MLDAVGSAPAGLSTDKAECRLDEDGPNRLCEIEHRSVLEILWERLTSLVVLLLVAAMGVSFFFG